MATVLETPHAPTMRDTDYLNTRETVATPQLGDGVECWVGGEGVPPLFIERRSEELADYDAFHAWVAEHRVDLDALIVQHGAVMLRGFPVRSAEDFNKLMSIFPKYEPGYVAGMSPRKSVTGQVLESTRIDERFKIILHSEMAYMKSYPPRLAFFSKVTAAKGGETIIGSLREFMKRFPADIKAKLEGHKVHVIRNFAPAGNTRDAASVDHPDKIGWDDAFFTDSKEEVEAHCRKLGIEPIWHKNGALTLREASDIFAQHPVTGERIYRCNLHANHTYDRDPAFAEVAREVRASQRYPTGHYIDTGEKLSTEESEAILGTFEQVELAWPWQNSDVMILDNLLCAHGRNPFSGPREVLVALLDR